MHSALPVKKITSTMVLGCDCATIVGRAEGGFQGIVAEPLFIIASMMAPVVDANEK